MTWSVRQESHGTTFRHFSGNFRVIHTIHPVAEIIVPNRQHDIGNVGACVDVEHRLDTDQQRTRIYRVRIGDAAKPEGFPEWREMQFAGVAPREEAILLGRIELGYRVFDVEPEPAS